MDLFGCYDSDTEKPLPQKRKLRSPREVFGISRRTIFNLEMTTKRAKKLPGRSKSILGAFNDEPDFLI